LKTGGPDRRFVTGADKSAINDPDRRG